MQLIFTVIKTTAIYVWDELFYLALANFLTLLLILTGPSLLLSSFPDKLLLILPGVLFTLAIPPALFGLFWLTYEISENKSIGFGTYFEGAKQFLKQAYIWGVINLVMGAVLASNIIFYQNIEASWGAYVSMFFVGLTILWFMGQLMALALYPKLTEPSFKLALRNGFILMALQPLAMIVLIILVALLILVGLRLPPVLALLSLSVIALLTTVTTREILKVAPREKSEE